VCQSQDAIDKFFTDTTLSFPLVNSYFDFTDYITRDMNDLRDVETVGSVKQFIDDRYFFQLEPNRQKMSNIYLMKSQAILKDDYVQLG
jgi:hypothetical protein